MKKFFVLVFLFSAVFLLTASRGFSEDRPYKDGVFVGEYDFIKARVTVLDGKISGIEILDHGGGGEEYENKLKGLIPLIIERQSTEVDGITGATTSSTNLKKAVEDALKQSEMLSE